MDRHNYIDCYENINNNLILSVQVDPKKHTEQENNTQFPWIYRIRSSVIYTEEYDPERRIRDAYCRSVKQEQGTLLFHPYKKPYTSRIFKRFILEDPHDPQLATIKHCREKPIKFIIFGKPGVNADNLGKEIAKYWKCVYISPDSVIKNSASFKLDKKLQDKIQSGAFIGLEKIWKFIRDAINSPDSKRQGYILCGLPTGYHNNAEFDVIEQMESIFQIDSRPDIIIYITCPSTEVMAFNEQGFIEDLNSGYYYNVSHIKDGEKLSNSSPSAEANKREDLDYNYYLKKEYENFYEKEKSGLIIKTKKLPLYTKNSLDTYIKKILPLIDSYILEYDPQCVIKVDGRVPVMKMLDIFKEKMNTLPFLPVSEAKPLFEQNIVVKTDIEFLDDRSEDSIEEGNLEIYEEEIEEDDDDEKDVETEEETEEVTENKETTEEGEDEGDKGDEKNPADYFNKIEPEAALQRLKNWKPIHPDFKWHQSDFGILCPVEHERGNICKGIAGYTCLYLGKLYMISSLRAMEEFLYDPNQFIIPPKPFPTLKIFVIGPPCSGKTTTAKLLSEFFQLKIISIKELIEEIKMKNFYELEIVEFIKKIIKVKKLEELEEEKLNNFEKQRAEDIIDWIRSVLPIIYERAKYSSLINISELEDQEEEKKAESESDQPEESDKNIKLETTREKLILPKVPDFLKSIKNISHAELKQIISKKKYQVDFPTKSGMKPIFINPISDHKTMLLKKTPYESADKDLKSLRNEFKSRGLDVIFSDTEECLKILNDPTGLLPYIPNEMCKPYHEKPIVDFYDDRILKSHVEDHGIRTAISYVDCEMEKLGDLLEKKVLDIEAEINMKRKTNDLRIGGWIVDDVPLQKIFWSTLTEKFLLPDDIIFQKVTNENYNDIIHNFCSIVNFQEQNLDGKENLIEESKLLPIDLTLDKSSDSIIDPQMNRFLDVKNSFIKINEHYETTLQPTEHNVPKKVCSEPNNTEKETDYTNIIKEDTKNDTKYIDEYIWTTAESLEYSRKHSHLHYIQNPFDTKAHYLKPFYNNFWNDDLFLTKVFEEITNQRITPEVIKNADTTEPGQERHETNSDIIKRDTSKSEDKSKKENKQSRSSLTNKINIDKEESISSTSSEEVSNELKKRNTTKISQSTNKIKMSLSKKRKSTSKQTIVLRNPKKSLISSRDSPFKLRDTIIQDTTKYVNSLHDLLEIFQKNITSFLTDESQKIQLKYLNEIKDLLEEDADIKKIGKAMEKYIKRIDEISIETSEDNIIFETDLPDIDSIDKIIKLGKGAKLLNIFSEREPRSPIKRTQSKINLNETSEESVSLVPLQRRSAEIQISATTLPKIKKKKMTRQEKDSLKNLFDPVRNKDTEKDKEFRENGREEIKNTDEKGDEEEMNEHEEFEEEDEEMIEEYEEMGEEEASYEELIYPDSSDIICHISSDKEFLRSSSEAVAIIGSPISSEIAIKTRRTSKKLQLPQIVQSESTIEEIHPCSCNTGEKQEEFCTCQTSSESEIMLGRRKKRLCIWHKSSSDIIPWTSTREKEKNLRKLQLEEAEIIKLKKLRNRLELPTISKSERESIGNSTNEEETEAKDILYHEGVESALSIVYATSSTDVLRWRKKPDWEYDQLDDSTEQFDLDEKSDTTLMSKGDYNSQTLLPNITAIEWERFINFVNSIYLNVSTLQEVDYNSISSTLGTFYLECCPSGSDSSMSDSRDNSTQQLLEQNDQVFTNKIKAIAKEFVTKLYGQLPDDYYDPQSLTNLDANEDLCVLEVNLPLTESKFSIALNTALTCLTHGKTISELFSADKHEYSGKKRLSSFQLNIMAQDETVKEKELNNITSSIDRISTRISISDELYRKDPHGRPEFVELFQGNLIRYQSLDQCLRDVERYEAEENEEEGEKLENNLVKLFLLTVPRAILYVPLVVDKYCNITQATLVTSEHLQRYYSLQTRCRLICDDTNEDSVSFRYILHEPPTTTHKKIYIEKKIPSETTMEERLDENENENESDREDDEQDNERAEEEEEEEEEEDEEGDRDKVKHADNINKKRDNAEHEMKGTENGEKDNPSIEDENMNENNTLNGEEQNLAEAAQEEQIESYENHKPKLKVRFAFPYDIMKLLVDKYTTIGLELSDDDYNDNDDELNLALSSMTVPKSFDRFLHALNYNLKVWLNEWDVFQNETFKDINCNLLSNDFVPFYSDVQMHLNNTMLNLLQKYEPTAYLNKEQLIKTTNLETTDLETESFKEEEVRDTTIMERDIGDVDIRELLPDEYSDFYPYCPVIIGDRNELVPANDTYKARFRDEWYNFSSEDAMNKFAERPGKYIPLKKSEYISMPLRICIVGPGDFNGANLGRNIADFFATPFVTLTTEMKRIKNDWIDLPIGVFDEDQVNIKLFRLEENDKKYDYLENENWDHFRNYINHLSPLTDQEIDSLILPLWKQNLGFTFYSFPHSLNDLEYLTKKEMVPDIIVFIDVEKQRKKQKEMFEERIKTRQLLNFGARLKKLLAADHLRFKTWKDVYPKLFNIVLRKFLKERRAERNFQERLKLVKPTVITVPLETPEEIEEENEIQDWDVDWLLSQVNNAATSPGNLGFIPKRVKKFTNVMDDPSIKPEIKDEFLDSLQIKPVIPQADNIENDKTSVLSKTSSASSKRLSSEKPPSNDFPNLRVLLEPTTEEDENEDSPESSDSSTEVPDLTDYRNVALTDFFEPSFTNRYLPKCIPPIFPSKRSFDENEYRHNVTDASSTSSLGLDEIDSIQSREITSSLSLMDIDSFNREQRLLHLIFGKQPPLKGHLSDIVKKYKELYPTPKTNIRNLQKVRLSHSKDVLDEYYNREKENITKMQDLCNKKNIAYTIYKSTSSFDELLKTIKNLIRKPYALDKVYVINYKLATELIENGLYFLSRFGYWCPVQIYEKENPILCHYPNKVQENKVIPVIHKRYIYFINGRNSAIKFSETPLKYIKQDTMLSIFPIKLAIIGSHKSRKSSTAKNLAKIHGLELITLEKVLNYVTENLHWMYLSKTITKSLRKGTTLPNTNLIECIGAFINGSPKSLTYGWVLDGFPISDDDIELMKESDIIPHVIFSIESRDEYTKTMFENLSNDRDEIQKIIYENSEHIDMINDEYEDNYYKKNQLNPTEIRDFEQKLIEFEINRLLPPVLIMETRMVEWLYAIKQYDRLLDKAHSKWGNVHKVEWKKDENELLHSVNEILIVYLWALQDYNSNIMKGLPASIYLVGITEDEYHLHKSPFKDCCPGCWYYNRIYFRCPTCKYEDMKPGLIQYENFFYWLCLQHYDIFLSDPLKFLLSYKTAFGKEYLEKANVGDKYITDNFDVMCDGLCVTCYYRNLPDVVHNKGHSKYSVLIQKKKIYLFCSDKCASEMLMTPTRFLNLEIDYIHKTDLPPLKKLTPYLPPKGLFEQLVTDAIYEGIRKFLFLRPKIFKLSHKTSACTYLALNLKLKAKDIPDEERNYYKSLLEFFENHCKENEVLCKNINNIIAFMSPLSIYEYARTKSLPPAIQDLILDNLLPIYKGRKKR